MDRVVLVYGLNDALPDAGQRLRQDWPEVEPVVDATRMTVVNSAVLWGQIRTGAVELKSLLGSVTEAEVSGDFLDVVVEDGASVKDISLPSRTEAPAVGARVLVRYVETPFPPNSPLAGRVSTSLVEVWLPAR